MAAQPLYKFWDPKVQCPYGAPNFLACQSFLCQQCAYHRGHQKKGYGRSLTCKCMYCQHFPARAVPYDRELELEVTGAVAPAVQYQVVNGD